ncbi:MAG TPA: T9SS type A sorting domain-containing protein [Bacteroidales bacterium]|nr:T9SS type A sorting domain-containing protein [Bacteroidales bacterium]
MLQKISIISFLFVFGFSQAFSTIYYVATDGIDTNSGSITEPFLTVQRAQTSVIAGDTVYIRGGNYVMTESQIALKYSIWAYVTNLSKSGSAGKRINYWAYPGEKPVFDYTNVKPSNLRVFAFMVTGSYIHLKGLEVIGVQVTILTHTQSECFHNEGSNNIYEQLSMHDGMAIGFYLTKGSNNLVLNCDAYRNYDSVSENKLGGNTDGFGFHPNAKGYTGNVIRGCRAWFNSDDGYDCINADEGTRFENCWAFYNGFSSTFASKGDGNGFKVGGYGAAPVVSGLPNPIPSNTVQFCMAYRNKANGFYSNHHVTAGNYFYNNTAYRNSTNYNMLSQKIIKSPSTGLDTSVDCPGYNHVLHNNLSFKYSNYRDTLNMGSCNITYNSFTPGNGVTVDINDFLSVDEALLVAPRGADGSLPVNNFLRLNSTSDLINKGMNLGFAFSGSAPDFGAFEYNEPNSLKTLKNHNLTGNLQLYPNATDSKSFLLQFYLKQPSNVTVSLVDLLGHVAYKKCFTALVSNEIKQELNLSNLKKGMYLVCVRTEKEVQSVKLII